MPARRRPFGSKYLLAAAAAILALAAAPGSASAVTCDQTFRDSFGGVWDMRTAPASIGDGSIDLGGGNLRSDAFDHFPVLNVSNDGGASWTAFAGDNGECTLEAGGRQVGFPAQSIAGLDVSRKVYVPASGLAFARFLDVLHNPTGSPITVTLDIGGGRAGNGELGSDTTTTVNDSSTGDGSATPGDTSAMTTFDNWATSWDTNPAGDPTLAHDWQTNLPSAVDRADVVGVDSGQPDRFVWQYDSVAVQPGQTAIYMNTEAMRANLSQTHDIAGALGQEPTELFASMSLSQLDSLRNWDGSDVDHDGVKNDSDNCLFVQNADQSDIDHDGQGDACDDDMDGDGLSNEVELQIGTDPRNPDTDFDGISDRDDACPKTPGVGPNGCPSPATGSSSPKSSSPLRVGVTMPRIISRSRFIKGFTVGAACDARCSLELTLFGDVRLRGNGGLRIAGFNHVFAFTAAPSGTGQRNVKIGACVRRNGRVSRSCVRRVSKALPRRGRHFKLRLAVTGADGFGGRTTARRTFTVR